MSECCQDKGARNEPLSWFANMIGNCYEYATKAKGKGRGSWGSCVSLRRGN